MSLSIDDQLKSIQAKLQLALKQYQAMQKENQQLKQSLEKSAQQLNARNEQLQQLQQQMDVLKLGVRHWDAAEKADLDKRIDGYLKEIEKCLALLNN